MKIVICAIPAILAAVLMTGPFDARGDGGDREDAAVLRANTDDPGRTERSRELETDGRLTDRRAPRLAAERPREESLTSPEPHREAAGEWQVVRQRRRDVERDSEPSRLEADGDRLARQQEVQRDEFLRQQEQQLEELLELQRRQLEDLLEQQDRQREEFLTQQEQARAAAEQQRERSLRQDDPFAGQREQLEPDRNSQLYGSDIRPIPDADPAEELDHGPYRDHPVDAYRDDDRRYEPYRRDTIEIPLPGRRTLRFWLR